MLTAVLRPSAPENESLFGGGVCSGPSSASFFTNLSLPLVFWILKAGADFDGRILVSDFFLQQRHVRKGHSKWSHSAGLLESKIPIDPLV